MKAILSFLAAYIIVVSGIAQEIQPPCGVVPYLQKKSETHPGYWEGIQRAEVRAQKWLAQHLDHLKDDATHITIPVVVHVVYNENSPEQDIPKEWILSQIEVLNEEYNRLSADTVRTREVFDTIVSHVDVSFALASIDPDGNPTDGITRTATSHTSFDIFPFGGGATDLEDVKHTDRGGQDAWPTRRYLNLWVANLTAFGSEGLYGIATFPRNAPPEEVENQEPAPEDEQGAVVHYTRFGKYHDGMGTYPSLGRIAVHEVGHYLGLRHIWADEQDPFGGAGDCEKDDFVRDTPMANQPSNFECPIGRNSCSNENEFSDNYWGTLDPPDMVENFMDYANEECQNAFTRGQFQRMWSFLETGRDSLYKHGNANGKEQGTFQAFGLTDPAFCAADCDGLVLLKAVNGTAPYTYELEGFPAQITPEFTQVCPGIYNATVRDANNETVSFELFVDSILTPITFNLTSSDASCSTCDDGMAQIMDATGNGMVTIVWNTSPEQIGETATGLLPGTYTVTLTDQCGSVATESFVIGAPVGITSVESENISLYPNPANDRFRVNLESDEPLQVQIADVYGKMIQTAYTNRWINTANLSQGVYLVFVVNSEGVRQPAGRLVKR